MGAAGNFKTVDPTAEGNGTGKSNVPLFLAGVPVAVTVDKVAAALKGAEARGKLVAVAVVKPVVATSGVDEEGHRLGILLGGKAGDVKQGMNISQHIAAASQIKSHKDVGNAHIGEGVVRAFDQNAHRVPGVVADDVDVIDVRIGGIVVGAVLDVNAAQGVFDGEITHVGLASAVDGQPAPHRARQ